VDEVVEEVGSLVQRGAREVTLLGQNVDAYGRDLPSQPDLADLLSAVHEIEELRRIRFLTSHPGDMSERVIEAVAGLERVCEHIELPVQAGHDLTLKRMGRGYTVDQYRRLLTRIRERVPGVAVATDVIVGFPGETKHHFQATCGFLTEARFDVVHIAAYSPRPGTPAASLKDDVPPAEKERRRRLVEELQQRIASDINHQLLGSTTQVLVEEQRKGRWKGRTRASKLVFFEDHSDWRGRLVPVEITWAGPWSMLGEVKAPRPS
jgi:tRNA-2-methylthio-N6-dimethylallyladenosine synthase